MAIKEWKTNDLIPILIDKFSTYSSKLQDRIKINGIFSEFDENARAQLNNFIKMSQIRYKAVKSGNDLQNIWIKQKPQYNGLSKVIWNDQFYQTKDIDTENKKLFKKGDKKTNQEWSELRLKILEGAKDFSKLELEIRARLYEKIRPKREALKMEEMNRKTWRNYAYEPYAADRMTWNQNVVEHEDVGETELKNNHELSLKEKRDFVEELMNEDEANFNNNIHSYLDYVREFKDNKQQGSQGKLANPVGKFNFLTENIKMLTYKEEKNVNVVPKKKPDTKIDIRKLMRYTRRGKSGKYGSSSSIVNSATEAETSLTDGFGKTFSDFRNTIKTVKSEAEKVLFIDENFDKKKDTMNNFFKPYDLAQVDDYANMIKTRSGFGVNTNKERERGLGSFKIGHENNRKQRNILSGFTKTYNNKKWEWVAQDKEKEKQKLKLIQEKKEINNYLNEIKNVQRKPMWYVDKYSTRDGITNERLKKFNKTLGNGFYNKKKWEHKLNKFQDNIRNREVQLAFEQLEEREMMENDWKKQKNELENEIMEKIRTNIQNQCEAEEDINLLVNVPTVHASGKRSLGKPEKKTMTKEEVEKKYKEYEEISEIIEQREKDRKEEEIRKLIGDGKPKMVRTKGEIGDRNKLVSDKNEVKKNREDNIKNLKLEVDLGEWPNEENGKEIGENNTKLMLVEHIKETD